MKPHEKILQMLATVSKDDEKTLDERGGLIVVMEYWRIVQLVLYYLRKNLYFTKYEREKYA